MATRRNARVNIHLFSAWVGSEPTAGGFAITATMVDSVDHCSCNNLIEKEPESGLRPRPGEPMALYSRSWLVITVQGHNLLYRLFLFAPHTQTNRHLVNVSLKTIPCLSSRCSTITVLGSVEFIVTVAVYGTRAISAVQASADSSKLSNTTTVSMSFSSS